MAGRLLSGTLLLSGGERVRPGLLAQADLRFGAERRRLEGELELLGGACSRDYRTPEGDPAAAELQAGARLAARLKRPARGDTAGGPGVEEISLEAAANRLLEHPAPRLFPAGEAGCAEGRTEWSLEGALRLRGAGALHAGVEGKATDGGLAAAVSLEGAAGGVRLETDGGRLRVEAEAGPLRLTIAAAGGRLEPNLGFSTGASGGEHGRWWAEAGVRDGRPRARLGWQVIR